MHPTEQQPVTAPHVAGGGRRSRRIVKHTIEVAIGAVLALAFFLILLGALIAMFPDSTPIASLGRQRDGGGPAGRDGLRLDGIDSDTGIRIAMLSGTERTVRDKSAGSVIWETAEVGKSLGDRHAVQTSNQSRATIEFDGTSRLELAENSLVVVRRPNRMARSWRSRASVVFIDGELSGRLDGDADAENQVDIVAQGRTIAPTGVGGPASFELRTESDGSTTLALHGGGVEIRRGDEVIDIPANHAVTFDENGVGRAKALPPPPALVRPASGSAFVYRANPPRVELGWRPRVGERPHRITIASDPGFEDVVHRQDVTEDGFVHGNLAEGEYYWRVSAMLDDIPGAPSSPRRFRVKRDATPPALDVDLSRDLEDPAVLRVSGRTEPGATLLVGDREIDVQHDGRFDQRHRVRPGLNFIVIQAIDPVGNATFHSEELGAGPLVGRSAP